MSDTAPEIRIYPLELRDLELTGTKPYRYLEGRAVPYSTWQDVGPFWESHAPGSFERSTNGGSGKGLPLLVGHDPTDLDNIIGRSEKWTHQADGLHGVWRINDQPKSQQAAALARSGDLTGLSVGFQEVDAKQVPRQPGYPESAARKPWIQRTQSRLLEVSLTPMPAYPEAGVVLVRSGVSLDGWAPPGVPTPDLEAWRARVEELRGATLRG